MDKNYTEVYCKNNGNELVIFSAIISILIAKDLSVNDQNLLSTLLQAIGQNLAVTGAVQSKCEEKIQDNS